MNKDLEAILARLAAIEAILARLEAINAYTIPYTWKDCGCPPTTVCMNIACPRQTRVTCETK
jgi:hypothetical protein